MTLELDGTHSSEGPAYYQELASRRADASELRRCIDDVVSHLSRVETTNQRPGMLLGKIQSGKTRAFIGVIAKAFDKGFAVAIIFTKSTKPLTRQTVLRIAEDFKEFRLRDEVQVYDIMFLPELVQYELDQKLIIVAKKQKDNLRRLIDFFGTEHPDLA